MDAFNGGLYFLQSQKKSLFGNNKENKKHLEAMSVRKEFLHFPLIRKKEIGHDVCLFRELATREDIICNYLFILF